MNLYYAKKTRLMTSFAALSLFWTSIPVQASFPEEQSEKFVTGSPSCSSLKRKYEDTEKETFSQNYKENIFPQFSEIFKATTVSILQSFLETQNLQDYQGVLENLVSEKNKNFLKKKVKNAIQDAFFPEGEEADILISDLKKFIFRDRRKIPFPMSSPYFPKIFSKRELCRVDCIKKRMSFGIFKVT